MRIPNKIDGSRIVQNWKKLLCILLVLVLQLGIFSFVKTTAHAADNKITLSADRTTVSSEQSTGGAIKLTNGVTDQWNERWVAQGYTSGTGMQEWVKTDLGGLYEVDKFVFYSITADGRAMPTAFEIQVSLNGTEWTTVHTETAYGTNGTIVHSFEFETVKAQYVRLYVTATHTAWSGDVHYVSLVEIEVYGTEYEVPSSEKITLNADKTTVSSEQAAGSAIKLTNCVTDQWNERWVSQAYTTGTGMQEWVKTDLGDIYEVDKFVFYSVTANGRAMPTAFEIQVSMNGTDWDTVHTETAYATNGTIVHSFEFDAVKAQFVRLYVTATHTAWSGETHYVSLIEIEVYGTEWVAPTSDKLTLDADKTTVSTEQGTGSAVKLTNGVTDQWNERWIAQSYTTGTGMQEWVMTDLGQAYEVDKFVFYTVTADGRAMPTAFEIQVSTNGTDWNTVHTETAYAPNGTIEHSFSFRATKARFVRLYVTATHTAWSGENHYVSLIEIEVYGFELPPEEPLPKLNLVPAQVTLSADTSSGGTTKLTDDITTQWNSRWCSQAYEGLTGMEEWIVVDLDTVHEIDKLAFYTVTNDGRAMPTAFEIQVSMNGTSWTTVHAETAYAPCGTIAHAFSFERTQARYVRLYITAIYAPWDANTNYVSLIELELYGQDTGKLPPLEADQVVIGEDGRLHYEAYLNGLSGNTGIPNWDPNNLLVTTSKSLEVGWATGYGKGFLIDGIAKGDNPSTQGLYASINLAEDGITLTGANESQNVDEFITLNLLDKYTIDTYGFASYLKGSNRGMPEDFTIDVSNDGVSWNTVYTATAFPVQSGKLWYFVEFTPVECQYVRLHVTKVGDIIDDNLQYSVMLTEIAAYLSGEEYIEPIVPQPEPLPDLVVVHDDGRIDLSAYLEGRNDYLTMPNWDIDNQVISASKSLEVPWMPGYGKGFLIDGIALGDDYPVNHGVFLTAGFNGRDYVGLNTTNDVDEWVIMNLQKSFTIDRVDLGAYRYGDEYGFPSDFEILVSSDGMTWETVLTVEDYFVPFNKTLHTFTFDAVECQYVQIRVSRICDWFDPAIQYALTLSEMIVYEAGHGQ